ncbi:HNH endonuclease [Staphylococcus sp. HMSC10C03]|uniref:HNH endonuclease n=1 Tax=Staphylococcus sp. HMSC10C03 TaxID=1581078 RepID=UPI0009F2D4AD|nr:HNH endonuclease [Staphylococcus sp. HMSC10C03]
MGIMRRCSHPTCNTLISHNETYCNKHKTYINDKYNDLRQRNDPEYLRFYKSKQWQNTRELVMIDNHYLCRQCGRQANVVDHIIPTKVDWSKRLEKENLQPLCNECHNRKTKREQSEVPHRK